MHSNQFQFMPAPFLYTRILNFFKINYQMRQRQQQQRFYHNSRILHLIIDQFSILIMGDIYNSWWILIIINSNSYHFYFQFAKSKHMKSIFVTISLSFQAIFFLIFLDNLSILKIKNYLLWNYINIYEKVAIEWFFLYITNPQVIKLYNSIISQSSSARRVAGLLNSL